MTDLARAAGESSATTGLRSIRGAALRRRMSSRQVTVRAIRMPSSAAGCASSRSPTRWSRGGWPRPRCSAKTAPMCPSPGSGPTSTGSGSRWQGSREGADRTVTRGAVRRRVVHHLPPARRGADRGGRGQQRARVHLLPAAGGGAGPSRSGRARGPLRSRQDAALSRIRGEERPSGGAAKRSDLRAVPQTEARNGRSRGGNGRMEEVGGRSRRLVVASQRQDHVEEKFHRRQNDPRKQVELQAQRHAEERRQGDQPDARWTRPKRSRRA